MMNSKEFKNYFKKQKPEMGVIILTGLKAQLNIFYSEHEALRTVRNGGVLI